MWSMSKKSRNKNAKKVLGSFADLGNTGKNTLSRLATTVKADLPTMILGNKDPFAGTVKTDSIKLQGENRVSKLAKRLMPFRVAQAGVVQNKPAAARLKHIAGKMGKAAVPKTRKSKGMIWLFVFFTALTGGSYYAWQSIDGIGTKIANIVDYKTWLNTTSGKIKPTTSEINIGSRQKTSGTTVYSGSSKPSQSFTAQKSSTVKTKTLTVKKSSKPTVVKKANKASASKKVANNAKAKQWEQKLAKLKKKSQADYRKASLKYRQKQK
jgi:hypothetical protein